MKECPVGAQNPCMKDSLPSFGVCLGLFQFAVPMSWMIWLRSHSPGTLGAGYLKQGCYIGILKTILFASSRNHLWIVKQQQQNGFRSTQGYLLQGLLFQGNPSAPFRRPTQSPIISTQSPSFHTRSKTPRGPARRRAGRRGAGLPGPRAKAFRREAEAGLRVGIRVGATGTWVLSGCLSAPPLPRAAGRGDRVGTAESGLPARVKGAPDS